MAKNRNTQQPSPVATKSAENAVVEAMEPSIQIAHDWRRQAVAKQLVRLWHAAELGRDVSAPSPGDECINQQQILFAEFSRKLLGDDAPIMEASQ